MRVPMLKEKKIEKPRGTLQNDQTAVLLNLGPESGKKKSRAKGRQPKTKSARGLARRSGLLTASARSGTVDSKEKKRHGWTLPAVVKERRLPAFARPLSFMLKCSSTATRQGRLNFRVHTRAAASISGDTIARSWAWHVASKATPGYEILIWCIVECRPLLRIEPPCSSCRLSLRLFVSDS